MNGYPTDSDLRQWALSHAMDRYKTAVGHGVAFATPILDVAEQYYAFLKAGSTPEPETTEETNQCSVGGSNDFYPSRSVQILQVGNDLDELHVNTNNGQSVYVNGVKVTG